MKLLKMLASAVFALLLAFTSVQGIAHADATTVSSQPVCYTFSSNLGYGSDDSSSQNQITQLQTFLSTKGFFDASSIGTGHFGPMTLKAVMRFQTSQGVSATGYVGPLTRAAIARIQTDCGSTPTPISTNAPAVLDSINPTAAAVGATVTLTGSGLTASSTVLFGGNVVARDVPVTSSIVVTCTTNSTCHNTPHQTITFTIPSSISPNCPAGRMCPMYVRLVTPGPYDVTVQNANGTSNALTLTVIAAATQ